MPLSIKRDNIDARKLDFSDIGSGRRLPPVHPGEILRDEFLTPMQISVYEFANAIKVPRTRANDIVLGRRAITIDTAIRLARYLQILDPVSRRMMLEIAENYESLARRAAERLQEAIGGEAWGRHWSGRGAVPEGLLPATRRINQPIEPMMLGNSA